MKIGEVAQASGVSVDTVRYYERLGLVSSTHRTTGGFREFDAAAVERIGDVRALQACGVTLNEAAQLLAGGPYSCAQADDALDRVVARLDDAIAQLGEVKRRAEATRGRCASAACAHGDALSLSCC